MTWQSSRNLSLQRGQTFVLFVLLAPIMILFIGLAVDTGLIYIQNARLSRAVDSVALRLANNVEQTTARRQQIAETMIQANYPGFFPSGSSVPWGAAVGSPTSAAGETITATSGNNVLTINTRIVNLSQTPGSNAVEVVEASVSANTKHRTFFMGLADDFEYGGGDQLNQTGKSFTEVGFSANATAQRFPSVNVLVLDISSSMIGNNGAAAMIDGVKKFVDAFDNDRDFFLVVAYANKGYTIWPEAPNETDTVRGPYLGLPYYAPQRNFQQGIKDVMDGITFAHSTAGYEGLRYAAENVQKWLDNTLTSPGDRELLQINYVYFTDGRFDEHRSYFRGRGYGMDLNGNDDLSAPKLSVHNTYHDYEYIVGNNLSSVAYNDDVNTAITKSNLGRAQMLAAGPGGTVPLAGNVPGVAACNEQNIISNYRLDRNVGDNNDPGVESNGDWTWVPYNQTNWQRQFWDYTLLAGPGPGSNRGKGDAVTMTNTSILVYDSSQAGISNDAEYTQAHLMGERLKMYRASRFFFPLQIKSSLENPYLSRTDAEIAGTGGNANLRLPSAATTTHNGKIYHKLHTSLYQAARVRWSHLNDDTRYTNARLNYFPTCGIYANHYGSYVRRRVTGSYAPSSTNNPHIYDRDSGSRKTGWHVNTVRIQDYYPTYSIAGFADHNSDDGIAAGDDEDGYINRPSAGGVQDHTGRNNSGLVHGILSPHPSGANSNLNANTPTPVDERTLITSESADWRIRKFWSFHDNAWLNVNTGNQEDDSFFMARAQAHVLRQSDQQNATIYTVVFNNPSGAAKDSMADISNDPNFSFHNAGQSEGVYYDVGNDTSSLTAAFEDIASLITVRLSQ